MTTTTDTKALFEAEAKRLSDGYKTGYFHGFRNMEQYGLAEKHHCECLGAGVVEIDWYMTRTAERKPVIRVKWMFPTLASRMVRRNGYDFRRKTWACTSKEQKFPFTAEGLEAALRFADSL